MLGWGLGVRVAGGAIVFNSKKRDRSNTTTKTDIFVANNSKHCRVQQHTQRPLYPTTETRTVSPCWPSSGSYLASPTPLLRLLSSQPHLRRAGEQHSGTRALRQSEHVERALSARLDGLDGVVLVVRRGGWASQVIDLVYLELEGGRKDTSNNNQPQQQLQHTNPTAWEFSRNDDVTRRNCELSTNIFFRSWPKSRTLVQY